MIVFDEDERIGSFFGRSECARGVDGKQGHGEPFILSRNIGSGRRKKGGRVASRTGTARIDGLTGGVTGMSNDKRFVAWKTHHRRRKAAKAKMKLYEQGKLSYDKLPALAKVFLRRKRRAPAKAA